MSCNYRIVREEFKNGRVTFKIEKKVEHVERWVHLTNRDTIGDARSVIATLIGEELVSSEVVE
jgi:hypothetical protein